MSPQHLDSRAMRRRRRARFAAAPAHHPIPQLRWWRNSDLDQASSEAVDELRAALSLTMWPGRSDWPAAARGDVPTAIHHGIVVLAKDSPSAWTVDLAASALLVCAVDNPAAGLVLRHIRRRFAAPNNSSRHEEA